MTEAAPAATTPLRVLVVDPDDRIRESLSRLLPIGGRCLVVGGAGDADAAIELIEGMKPDVVMIDSRVAQGDAGADLVERFRVARRGIRIVVLNWSDGAAPAFALVGADAYIRKTFRPHELIDAVVNAGRPPA
jgi:two-component system response regulator DevR